MATARLKLAYREVRRAGDWTLVANALRARRSARTLVKWRAAERAGYVKLDVIDDPKFFNRISCEDYQAGPEAFGVVGYYLKPGAEPGSDHYGHWEHADSVWGHTGYADPGDWRENAYVLDIMTETLIALTASRRRHLTDAELLLSSI